MPHGLRSPETTGVVVMLTALAAVLLQRTLVEELDEVELEEPEEVDELVELDAAPEEIA